VKEVLAGRGSTLPASLVRSVLVDVVAVLVVTVTVVQVVHMVSVLHGLTAVAVGVRLVVGRVDSLFGVLFRAMDVVDVVTVLDCCAAVPRQVLVVGDDGVVCHVALLLLGADLGPILQGSPGPMGASRGRSTWQPDNRVSVY
jgi:hypothetical protein